ncbi:MAG: hypothetical protein MO852_13245, partial [Candidatus Devosia euplotis]|nr:hypothetical protein [Candidatus Devosia euplotis]
RRETLEFDLPQAQLALEPGDLVEIAGLAEGPFEIAEIRDGQTRRVTAHTLLAHKVGPVGADRPLRGGSGTAVRAVPVVTMAHLPALPAYPARSRLVTTGHAQPWPGPLQIADTVTGAAILALEQRDVLDELTAPLEAGASAVWDRANSIEVMLYAGRLAAAEPLAVLAGSNRLAIQTDAGDWGIVGFARAGLIAPSRYVLHDLLRGLDGTAPAMGIASSGRRVTLLDSRVRTLAVELAWLGEAPALSSMPAAAISPEPRWR